MKKDRNCNMTYPVYPNYMPNMMPMNNMPMNVPMNNMPINDIDNQINMINNKISNLERRISNLENNNYNSGYQMM